MDSRDQILAMIAMCIKHQLDLTRDECECGQEKPSFEYRCIVCEIKYRAGFPE